MAAQKGYRLILVMPDKMSQEKIFNLRAMGAEVVLTRSDVAKGHPEYYQDMAERMAEESPGAYFVNQFGNPDNVKAHRRPPARRSGSRWSTSWMRWWWAWVPAVRSPAVGHYCSRVAPQAEMVLADPKGSVLADYIKRADRPEAAAGWWKASARISSPTSATSRVVKQAYTIPDSESFLPRGSAAQGRRAAGLVLRHAAGGGAALLPRADQRRSAW